MEVYALNVPCCLPKCVIDDPQSSAKYVTCAVRAATAQAISLTHHIRGDVVMLVNFRRELDVRGDSVHNRGVIHKGGLQLNVCSCSAPHIAVSDVSIFYI